MTCTECKVKEGTPHLQRPDSPERELMEKIGLCFTCAFWQGYVERQWAFLTNPLGPQRPCVIVDGAHYVIAPDQEFGMKGFGGREFIIEFHDGRRVTTHNLWCQGSIPPHFRDRLPDNAKFLPVDLSR